MSDTPPSGAKAPPASETKPKEPPTPRSDAGTGTPAAAKAFDLKAWKRPTTVIPSPAAAKVGAPREQYPLVSWADLDGIRDLGVIDVWVADSVPTAEQPKSYPYVGANVLLPERLGAPSGAVVTVLTGQDTTAGKRLVAEFMRGTFDRVDRDHPVAVHVMSRYSPDPAKASKPYAVLTFG